MVTSYQIGIKAETIAKNYLTIKGYKILHERYKTKFGEIDIVALKNNQVIFIEVKKRKSNQELFYTITERQQERIYNSAVYFLQNNDYSNYDFRFDGIFIDAKNTISHLENIIIVQA